MVGSKAGKVVVAAAFSGDKDLSIKWQPDSSSLFSDKAHVILSALNIIDASAIG